MNKSMRLDKYMALCGAGSRLDSKKLIREGVVMVDDLPAESPAQKVSAQSRVTVSGQALVYEEYIYILLNKPAGYISATFDRFHPTVMDLLEGEYGHRELAPVGRLDEDTTGLMLITDDGALSHYLLSPKRHVAKVYHALLESPLKDGDAQAFADGLDLGDFICQSAKITALEGGWAEITLCEGKYHQVKRMAEAIGNHVLALRRVSFGPLSLGDDLPEGQWRRLSAQEVAALRSAVSQG